MSGLPFSIFSGPSMNPMAPSTSSGFMPAGINSIESQTHAPVAQLPLGAGILPTVENVLQDTGMGMGISTVWEPSIRKRGQLTRKWQKGDTYAGVPVFYRLLPKDPTSPHFKHPRHEHHEFFSLGELNRRCKHDPAMRRMFGRQRNAYGVPNGIASVYRLAGIQHDEQVDLYNTPLTYRGPISWCDDGRQEGANVGLILDKKSHAAEATVLYIVWMRFKYYDSTKQKQRAVFGGVRGDEDEMVGEGGVESMCRARRGYREALEKSLYWSEENDPKQMRQKKWRRWTAEKALERLREGREEEQKYPDEEEKQKKEEQYIKPFDQVAMPPVTAGTTIPISAGGDNGEVMWELDDEILHINPNRPRPYSSRKRKRQEEGAYSDDREEEEEEQEYYWQAIPVVCNAASEKDGMYKMTSPSIVHTVGLPFGYSDCEFQSSAQLVGIVTHLRFGHSNPTASQQELARKVVFPTTRSEEHKETIPEVDRVIYHVNGGRVLLAP